MTVGRYPPSQEFAPPLELEGSLDGFLWGCLFDTAISNISKCPRQRIKDRLSPKLKSVDGTIINQLRSGEQNDEREKRICTERASGISQFFGDPNAYSIQSGHERRGILGKRLWEICPSCLADRQDVREMLGEPGQCHCQGMYACRE